MQHSIARGCYETTLICCDSFLDDGTTTEGLVAREEYEWERQKGGFSRASRRIL